MEFIKLNHSHKVDYDLMYQYLIDAKEIFTLFNAKWCLFGGTLLGAVRNGDFISEDYDIDIFFFQKDWHKIKLISELFEKKGYTIKFFNGAPVFLVIFGKGEEWIDVWIMTKQSDGYYESHKYSFHGKFFDKMKIAKIRNLECPIPNHAKEFLKIFYGSNWRIPGEGNAEFVKNKELFKVLNERKKLGI